MDLFFFLNCGLAFCKNKPYTDLGTDTRDLYQIEVCILCPPVSNTRHGEEFIKRFDKGEPEQSLSLLQTDPAKEHKQQISSFAVWTVFLCRNVHLTTLSKPLKLRDHELFPLLFSSVGKPRSALPFVLRMQRYGDTEGRRSVRHS